MDISVSQDPDFSALNNSKSKQSYSFARNDRFKDLYSKKVLPVSYDIPVIKDNRTCTFGKGNKFDFFQLVKKNQPSPSAYTLKSEFQKPEQIQIYKGASFGVPREQMYLQIIPKSNENPGPGQYISGSALAKTGVSIISRHDQCSPSYVKAPGPGAYTPKDLFPQNGRFVQSNYNNVISGKIYSSTERFKLPHGYLDTPAPAHYYNQEKKKKEIGYSFGSGQRSEISIRHMKDTPGPGKYSAPSDFNSKKLLKINFSSKLEDLDKSKTQDQQQQQQKKEKKPEKQENNIIKQQEAN